MFQLLPTFQISSYATLPPSSLLWPCSTSSSSFLPPSFPPQCPCTCSSLCLEWTLSLPSLPGQFLLLKCHFLGEPSWTSLTLRTLSSLSWKPVLPLVGLVTTAIVHLLVRSIVWLFLARVSWTKPEAVIFNQLARSPLVFRPLLILPRFTHEEIKAGVSFGAWSDFLPDLHFVTIR